MVENAWKNLRELVMKQKGSRSTHRILKSNCMSFWAACFILNTFCTLALCNDEIMQLVNINGINLMATVQACPLFDQEPLDWLSCMALCAREAVVWTIDPGRLCSIARN